MIISYREGLKNKQIRVLSVKFVNEEVDNIDVVINELDGNSKIISTRHCSLNEHEIDTSCSYLSITDISALVKFWDRVNNKDFSTLKYVG